MTLAIAAAGCGSGDQTHIRELPGVTSGGGDEVPVTSTGSGGGQPVVRTGPSTTETVSAGRRVKSSAYILDFTLGQSIAYSGRASSSSYVLRGGFIGGSSQPAW